MFRLATQFRNVSNPVISGPGVVYTDSNKLLVKTGVNLATTETDPGAPFALIGIADDEMIVRIKEQLVSMDAGNTARKTYALPFTGDTQIKLFYDNDLIIVRNNTPHGWRLCKYDFRHSRIIWERKDNDTHGVFRFEAYLIVTQFENKDLLACFNEKDGALLWQLNINELDLPGTGYELSGQPLKYKNYLLIGIRQRFNMLLLGLDIATGQLRWHRQDTGLRFQLEDDSILSFSGNDIQQIDPVSGAIIHSVGVQDKIQAAGIDPYGNVVFKDGKMYLAGILDTIISVWNINTGDLLWQHRLYDTSLTGRRGISIPASENILQVHDNRIYVLDSERVLHVFEKI